MNDPRTSPAPGPARLEETILDLLAQRRPQATICPSEVARALGGESWRDLMEPTRQAAWRLVAAGQVEITQGGQVIDPHTAHGPIRIRRRPPGLVPAGDCGA